MKSFILRSLFIGMTIISTMLFIFYLYEKHGKYDVDTVNETFQTIGVILLCFHYSISYSHRDFDQNIKKILVMNTHYLKRN